MTMLTCPVCGKVTHFLSTSHIRLHGYGVSEFKSTFGLAYLKSDEMRRNQSLFMTRSNPTRGVGHTQESRDLISKNRTGKGIGSTGKYTRTPEIRSKISIGVSRAYLEGRAKSVGVGRYATSSKLPGGRAWVRSSWEERVIFVLDLHPQVLRVEVEPLSIPYVFEGVQRNYIPDFLVTFVGGVRELWEIKVDYLEKYPKTWAKRKALNEYAVSKGINSCWVNSWTLRGMEMQVGIQPWVGPGAPWVDLENPNIVPTKEGSYCEL